MIEEAADCLVHRSQNLSPKDPGVCLYLDLSGPEPPVYQIRGMTREKARSTFVSMDFQDVIFREIVDAFCRE
ncbi:MAG: hypothetical protein KAI66_04700, partial [Lentisphaeria bacterium]|nr:hypothetical protein [Lentisphaeria bacterium]